MLSVLGAMAVLAPWISPQDPLVQNRADQFKAPSLPHPFGTDEFGRDILSRVIHGARISLLTGAVAVLIGAAVGVPLGLLGGFAGGWTDAAIMRVLDFLLAVPAILLAMVIIAILGPGSFNAMLAVGVVSIPSFARLTRASTLSLKEREFVMATRALGVGPVYLMFRTILLNALTPIVVQVAVTGAVAMLLEAALSFLGLGTQPPDALVGLDAEHRPIVSPPGAVVRALPRHRDHALGALAQRAGGHAPDARGPRGRRARRRGGATRLMARYVLFRLLQLPPGAPGRVGRGLADDLPDPRRSRDRAPRAATSSPEQTQPGADAAWGSTARCRCSTPCGSAASCAGTSASRTSTGCR